MFFFRDFFGIFRMFCDHCCMFVSVIISVFCFCLWFSNKNSMFRCVLNKNQQFFPIFFAASAAKGRSNDICHKKRQRNKEVKNTLQSKKYNSQKGNTNAKNNAISKQKSKIKKNRPKNNKMHINVRTHIRIERI